MLKQDTIQKIEQLLKITGLAEAIKNESEVDVTIDDKLHIFTDDEIQTLKSNSYKDGKKAGVEMEVDDLKKEFGLEFQGKTVKGLTEAYKKKILDDAKIEPAKQVQELQEKLNTVQNSYKELEGKYKEKETEVETTIIKTDLFKYIPAPTEEGPALDQEDIVNLMKVKGYDFKRENGKVVAYKGGNKVTDKLGNDIEVKAVVDGFLKESKLRASEPPVPGGRGGSDKTPPAKAGSLSEIKKQFEAQGKSTLGQEFADAVAAAAKDNADFKMQD
jgi:ribosomal protein S13